MKLRHLPPRQLFVKVRLIGDVADALAGLISLGLQIEPGDANGAGIGKEQAAHQLDGRGLAGAVGPEEREELAAGHRQVQVIHGQLGAVLFGDVLQVDHYLADVCHSLWLGARHSLQTGPTMREFRS